MPTKKPNVKRATRQEPSGAKETGADRRKVAPAHKKGKGPDKLSPLGQQALALGESGFAVFLLGRKKKTPLLSKKQGGHGCLDATTDAATIREWWTKHPDANIAIATGARSGIVVPDPDSAAGYSALVEILNGEEPETATSQTSRGKHFLYAYPTDGAVASRNGLRPDLDLKADGGYIVAPPSIHPSGARYEWLGELTPATLRAHIAPLPPALLDAIRQPTNGNNSNPAPSVPPEPSAIPEGARNDKLTAKIGRWLRRGLSEDEVVILAHAYNQARCRPPLSDTEVDRIIRSISERERSGYIEELNRTYAIIQAGDKVRVLQETDHGDGYVLLTAEGFCLLLQNRTITPNGAKKPIQIAQEWLKSPKRRQLARLVFDPEHPDDPTVYNLFRGYPVTPGPGDCSMFLEHLHDHVCQKDAALYRWSEAWLANIVQHPADKPGTSLVLRGKQGVGKSIVGDLFGRLLGRYYAAVSKREHVTGRFNKHLAGKLLLQVEEGFWAGDHEAEAVLKDLVTNKSLWLELKGVDAIETPNHLRLLITSNSNWVVPAGLEERRFATLDVGEGRMKDTVYFREMIRRQKQEGGDAALLAHLLGVDCSKVDLRTIPVTSALLDQKVASLSPELKWLLDILSNGILPGDTQGEGWSPTTVLWDSFIRHAQQTGVRHRSIQVQLGNLLRKLFPGIKRERKIGGGHKLAYLYVFPSLLRCRKAFEEAAGQRIEWPGETTTWLPNDEGF